MESHQTDTPFITQRLNLLNSTGIPTHSNGHSGGFPRGAAPSSSTPNSPATPRQNPSSSTDSDDSSPIGRTQHSSP
uniref:Uncharacterized protein n=1 Tax=Desertifilum tharense IPPAS B-1220 TaxID=1781255 RepID=A0ACD5GVN6_9CYAN